MPAWDTHRTLKPWSAGMHHDVLGHAEPLGVPWGYPRHWYPTVDVEDDLVRGDGYGAWTCWLRQGDRVFLTNTVTGRGLEVSMPALALLDMTARGRLEAWQELPRGLAGGQEAGLVLA